MNTEDSVKTKIMGTANEVNRRKELWEKIYGGYEQGGEDVIKSVLIERSDSTTKEFDELLEQLRKKL